MEVKKSKGFKGMLATAGKRVLTGENLFTATFTNTSIDKKVVAFAAPYPGKIIPVNCLITADGLFVNEMPIYVLQKGLK